jgi:metal-sulfur cluster biosynthetic enzyme
MNREQATRALAKVIDPELGIDVVTLGFIRRLDVASDGEVKLVMTLTSPLCPMRQEIKGQVSQALKRAGASAVKISLEFDPPWQPPPAAKALLGL